MLRLYQLDYNINSQMQAKLLVCVGIYGLIAFSGYQVYTMLHQHYDELETQNRIKFSFLFYIHIFIAVALAFLLKLQNLYHQILLSFFLFFTIFSAIFVCESMSNGKGGEEEEEIEELRKKFKLEATYSSIYYLLYMCSIMGIALTGMFIFVSEGMNCWRGAPTNRYDGILIPLEYNETMQKMECSICLTEFIKGEKYQKIRKCGHIFHEECIKQWLKYNKICPLDRANIMQ